MKSSMGHIHQIKNRISNLILEYYLTSILIFVKSSLSPLCIPLKTSMAQKIVPISNIYLIQSATILDTVGSSLRTAIFNKTPDASPCAATCALAKTFIPPTKTPLK